MSRKPAFWIVLALISLSGIFFTFKYFSEAFPIVTLDLSMDRAGALKLAANLAAKYQWGPKNYSPAASFDLDSEVQDYVELEVGGSRAFKELLKGGLYSPYMWRVRHFKEGEPNETVIRFTPDGKPYGFHERLAEDARGASLSPEEARIIAEKAATEQWQILLNQYVAVETSQEERPGGRRDHTFVYERPNLKIGEGLYRLRLVVGGDRLTELTQFIKIPEAFDRRYEEMRSANETLASVAQYVVLILYLGVGCVVGLFFLLRQHWVIWKNPLRLGCSCCFLKPAWRPELLAIKLDVLQHGAFCPRFLSPANPFRNRRFCTLDNGSCPDIYGGRRVNPKSLPPDDPALETLVTGNNQ